MTQNPEIVRALAGQRVADLIRASTREGEDARRRTRARRSAAVRYGTSLRLRDGRWVHLRHDSA